ncbi:hypothetical protein WR25_14402 [Diploscapter pachys]|uniref:Uncharacterized protein n=1 Tax=Diploscapter pachys TaxID=2018661 RepID=A0A2A2LAK0_9BILA|nr:hypothetical protein WR25_14402 [Diploscapter pachys]
MLDRDKETVPLLESDVLEDGRKDDTVIEMPEVELSHGKLMENRKFLTFESTKVSLLRRLKWKHKMPHLDASSVAPLEISECESGSSGQISVTGMRLIALIAIFSCIVAFATSGIISQAGRRLAKRDQLEAIPTSTFPPGKEFDPGMVVGGQPQPGKIYNHYHKTLKTT